jgi:hypothetical protein
MMQTLSIVGFFFLYEYVCVVMNVFISQTWSKLVVAGWALPLSVSTGLSHSKDSSRVAKTKKKKKKDEPLSN